MKTIPLRGLLVGTLLVNIATSQAQNLNWQPLGEPSSGGWLTALRISPHDSKRILTGGDMLGAGLSTDGGASWGATTGFTSWEMNDFTFDPQNPNEVWVGTLSGPYKSLDGGKTWVSKRKGFPAQLYFGFSTPVERVIIDSNNPRHLITMGGSSRGWTLPGPRPQYGAVWESIDGGESWSKIATVGAGGNVDTAQGQSVYALSFAAKSSLLLYAAVPGVGFLRSTDGGKQWSVSNVGLPNTQVRRVVAHPTNTNILWCSLSNGQRDGKLTAGGIYQSIDGGLSWSSISQGLSQVVDPANANFTARYDGFDVAMSNPNMMVTADTAWNTGVIYVTKDGGKNWRAAATKNNLGHAQNSALQTAKSVETAYPAGLAGTYVAIDPKNPDHIWNIGSEHFIASDDGGTTWRDAGNMRTPNGWHGLGFSGLCSWNFRFSPFERGVAVLQAMDAARAWVSRDGLKSWSYGDGLGTPQPWGGGKDVAFSRDGTIYITTGQHGKFQGVGRSKDGGKTWKILAGGETGLPAWDTWNEPESIYTLPDDSSRVWAIIGKNLWASQDGGSHWSKLNLPEKLGFLAADPKKPLHLYVSGESTVFETNDGKTFTPIAGPRKAGRMVVDSSGQLYLAAQGGDRGGLWRYRASQPLVSRWTRLFSDKQILNVAVDPNDPSRLAVTTNMDPYGEISLATGVWISADSGQTWSAQNGGLAMLRGHAIAFDPFDSKTLVFGSFGRGFWKTRWDQNFRPIGTTRYVSTDEDAAFANTAPVPVAAR